MRESLSGYARLLLNRVVHPLRRAFETRLIFNRQNIQRQHRDHALLILI